MRPCISQATTLSSSFADDVIGYSEAGCRAIEVWLTKLETHLKSASIAETRKILDDREIELAAAAYQGGLLLTQGEQRSVHFDHFKRRLDLCQQLRIPTMLLVADFVPQPDAAGLQRALGSLTQAAQWAAGFDVRLALEFRGSDTFCNCLDTAITLVESCGEPNVGVCLDVFHYYKGPSKPEDLERLTCANLAHVQLCDVAGLPRELMSDSDRVFPGEGDFRLGPILDSLRAMHYPGWIALELMNPILWQSRTAQVAELGLMSLKRVLDNHAIFAQ